MGFNLNGLLGGVDGIKFMSKLKELKEADYSPTSLLERLQSSTSEGDIVNREFLLFGADYTKQEPTAVDTPIRVKFGDAQDTTEFTLAADGLLTCNVAGSYDFVFTAQVGREAVNGTAYMYLRILYAGSQIFQTLMVKVASNDVDRPVQVGFTLTNVNVAETIEIQCIRGSEGVNDGHLETISPAIGWDDVSSASIAITNHKVATK